MDNRVTAFGTFDANYLAEVDNWCFAACILNKNTRFKRCLSWRQLFIETSYSAVAARYKTAPLQG